MPFAHAVETMRIKDLTECYCASLREGPNPQKVKICFVTHETIFYSTVYLKTLSEKGNEYE